MWQRSIYKTVHTHEQLIEFLQSEIKNSKVNNEDLVIRELSSHGEMSSLILDSKPRINYDIKLESIKNATEIIDKINELKSKKDYWRDQLDIVLMSIHRDEYHLDLCERQISAFDNSIKALEFVLGENEL